MSTSKQQFVMYPVGTVHRNQCNVDILIDETYRPTLKGLGSFSHVMVFFWASRFDNPEYRQALDCQPPYAEGHVAGMFATRSPVRPNPILMTTCKILEVDEEKGLVRVADLDAFDGTPVVDLKAYFPVCDRVKEAHIPEWLAGWPEWMPETGIGLEEGEA